MKRKYLCLPAALCVGIAAMGFAACTDNGEKQPTDGSATVSVEPQTWTMKQYEDVRLEAAVTDADGTPSDAQVVWSSSDASVADVSADGSVIAYRPGEAVITATAGESSDDCAVTVEAATSLPALVVGPEDSLPLTVNESYPLDPYILYETVIYRDAELSYSSGDESVFTVSDEGEIKAVGAGTANLTVTASWRGLSGTALAANIPVTVKEDIAVSIAEEGAQIYSAAVQIGDRRFENTVTFTASVSENGNLVSMPKLVWKSSDETIADVDAGTGVVTGISEGTAEITAVYTSAIGAEYSSPSVPVTVSFPVADLSQTRHADLDLSEETIELDAEAILGDGQAVSSVYDVTDERTQIENTGNVLTKSDLIAGDRKLEVRGETYGCVISASVVTKIITSAQDLAMFRFTGSEQFDGYYILGNNIDATEYSHFTQSWGGGSSPYGGYGLTGVFDGRGYVIDGITLTVGGLFGAIGNGGVVRNVGFTNTVLTGTANNVSLLAHYACAGASVDNVFVHVSSWSATGNISALIVQLKDNTSNPAVPISLSNIFVVTPQAGGGGGTYSALFAGSSDVGENLTERSNIYVISPVALSSVAAEYSGVTQFADVESYIDANIDHEGGGYNDYWTFSETFPMFAAAADYAKAYFEEVGTALSLNAGEKWTAHPSFRASVSGIPEGYESYVTLADNVLTVAATLPADIVFQLSLSFAGVSESYEITVSAVAPEKTVTNVETVYDRQHGEEAGLKVQIAEEYLAGGGETVVVSAGERSEEAALSDGAVTISASMLNDLPAGRQTVTVETATHVLHYTNIYNVTKFIREAQDLQVFDYTKVNTFDGYYVLADNISAEGYTHFTQSWGSDYGNNGLLGEFDGRGYTISGIKFGPGGLFGAIGYGGIVRNVGFRDVIIDGANSTLLANYACANAVVDNVYVSVAEWGAGGNTNMSCLILQLKADQPSAAEVKNPVSISNITIVAPESSATTSYSRHGVLFAPSQDASGVSFRNVVIISMQPQSKKSDSGEEVTYAGVTQYADETEHREAGVDYSQSGFNSYWTLAKGEIPVFTSATVKE